MLSDDPTQKRKRSPCPPFVLLYVAASLRQAGYKVEILDCTFMQSIEQAEQIVRKTEARYIGIDSMITLTRNAVALAEAAKSAGKTVIYGGPDPSTTPDKYLKKGFGDYVVMGEGERTALELIRTLDRGDLPLDLKGLAFLNRDSLVTTPPRELERDLDSILPPARDLIDNERYKEVWRSDHGYALTSVMTTRGCPYGWFFCRGKPGFGGPYTVRSANNVVAELEDIIRKYGYDRV